VTRAVLPIDRGFEAPRRCGRFVRPASRIAERARNASAHAIAVTHRLVGMLLAYPALVTAQLAIGLGHRLS